MATLTTETDSIHRQSCPKERNDISYFMRIFTDELKDQIKRSIAAISEKDKLSEASRAEMRTLPNDEAPFYNIFEDGSRKAHEQSARRSLITLILKKAARKAKRESHKLMKLIKRSRRREKIRHKTGLTASSVSLRDRNGSDCKSFDSEQSEESVNNKENLANSQFSRTIPLEKLDVTKTAERFEGVESFVLESKIIRHDGSPQASWMCCTVSEKSFQPKEEKSNPTENLVRPKNLWENDLEELKSMMHNRLVNSITDQSNQPSLVKLELELGRRIKKCELPPHFFIKELTKRKSGWTQFYTDGSWRSYDDPMGIAWVCPSLEMSTRYRVDSGATISEGEALAIFLCLEYIEYADIKQAVVCTDSLNTLIALENANVRYKPHNLILAILLTIKRMSLAGREVEFWFCPAHMGIEGNELADSEAVSARRQGHAVSYLTKSGTCYRYSNRGLKRKNVEISNSVNSFNRKKRSIHI